MSEEKILSTSDKLKAHLQGIQAESVSEFFLDVNKGLDEVGGVADLSSSKLYRLEKPNSTQGQVFLCNLDPTMEINEEIIGLEYGGGHYKVDLRFYMPRESDPEKKDLLTRKVYNFSLDKVWDRKRDQKEEAESFSHIGRMKNLEKRIMGENENATSGDNARVSALESSMERMMSLFEKMMLSNMQQAQPQVQSGSMDFAGIAQLMIAMRPQEQISTKDLILLMQEKNKPTPQRSMISQVKEITELSALLKGESLPKEESTTEKFMGDFLPMVSDIASQLLERKAGMFPSQVQKRLDPYKEEINLINSNSEIQEATIEKLRQDGFSDSEISTVSKRAGIDLKVDQPQETDFVF